MRRIRTVLLLSALAGFGLSSSVLARPRKAAATRKVSKKKARPAKKAGPPPMVSAAHKKALAEKFAGFKFGMTKDEVLGVLRKQISDQYEEKIKSTTDVRMQDRYRHDKKKELARIAATYIEFKGKRTGWDVSIVEKEFAHHTGESMMERWENDNGKNQRRFFFFYNQRLWKMYISLDVSIIPEDKRTFDTFKTVMESQYGNGKVDAGTIAWRAGDFDVRAVDRLRDYSALGLVLEDPKVRGEVIALRESKAPPKKEQSAIIKAVVDTEDSDHYDIHANTGAVDAVIQSSGGSTKK